MGKLIGILLVFMLGYAFCYYDWMPELINLGKELLQQMKG